jgi:hypothetical protein
MTLPAPLRSFRRSLSVASCLATLALAGPGCIAQPGGDDDGLGTAVSAVIADPYQLPNVPGAPAPPGYGTYCSVTDPSNGGWAFTWRAPNAGDPCLALAARVGPNTVIQRAGLWAAYGNNNAMVRCGSTVYMGRAYGESALENIFNNVSGRGLSNCVFTISPTRIAGWGYPYTSTAIPSSTAVFDYDFVNAPWNIAAFGKLGGDSDACSVDRTGYETQSCKDNAAPPAQPDPPPYGAFEGAYDWSLPRDTPIRAVADGIIRGSQQRTVTPMCGTFSDGSPRQSLPGSKQLELFLETQVGTGQYAEHFIAAYHHMDASPVTWAAQLKVAEWGGPLPPVGTVVKKGDVIGFVGESGCSAGGVPGASSYHLDFSVLRLTNLTGARSYMFQPLLTTYDSSGHVLRGAAGVNGWQGLMDPFGWGAPRGVDPDAYKMIGLTPWFDAPANVTDMGTFGIALWDDEPFDIIPHNGQPAY